MSLGAYEISEAIANYGEPEWPNLTFMDILKIAFKKLPRYWFLGARHRTLWSSPRSNSLAEQRLRK